MATVIVRKDNIPIDVPPNSTVVVQNLGSDNLYFGDSPGFTIDTAVGTVLVGQAQSFLTPHWMRCLSSTTVVITTSEGVASNVVTDVAPSAVQIDSTGATNANVLVYDAASGRWKPGTQVVTDVATSPIQIDSTGVADTNVLAFNAASGRLKPGVGGSGSAPTIQGSSGVSLGATQTVDFGSTAKEIWLVGTLSANLTVTIAGRAPGASATLVLKQDGTGGRTVTVADYVSPTSPTITSTAGATSVVKIVCADQAATIAAAQSYNSVVLASTSATLGAMAQALTLPSSGVLAFAPSAAVPSGPTTAPFIQFPAPWAAVTNSPGVRLIVRNFSTGTPVQPTLLNADNSVFNGSISLVEPGSGHTSLGIINETAPGVPGSALKLALRNLVVGDAAGFNVEVKAWAV